VCDGGDSTDGGLVDKGGAMLATYSGLRPQVALVLEVGMAMGKAEGLVVRKMMRGTRACHLGQGKSTCPVEMACSMEMAELASRETGKVEGAASRKLKVEAVSGTGRLQ